MMPVLAVGGEKSFGSTQAVIMRNVAVNVREEVVPGSGHWLMEERPGYTVALIRRFLSGALPVSPTPAPTSREIRVAPAEFRFAAGSNPGTGSSGVEGIQTVVLTGDPLGAGLYTIMLRVPPHTRIAAHSHRDDRIATVVSGNWALGYGDHFQSDSLKLLPPGSFYTEPGGVTHFAQTADDPVVVQITGYRPSSTAYVKASDDPRTMKK
jgi:uncharacterized RmlC-like cupin family protein